MALVNDRDIHCTVIGATGVGETANFLYQSILNVPVRPAWAGSARISKEICSVTMRKSKKTAMVSTSLYWISEIWPVRMVIRWWHLFSSQLCPNWMLSWIRRWSRAGRARYLRCQTWWAVDFVGSHIQRYTAHARKGCAGASCAVTSIGTIAGERQLSIRMVERTIADLDHAGLLTREQRW